jgi:transcriptional regulator with XRE-family HTH domain
MNRQAMNRWVRLHLRDLREAQNLTVDDFAEKVGISKRQIYKIESGDTETTSVENLIRWTMLCGVHPSEFFGTFRAGKDDHAPRASDHFRLEELFMRALALPEKRDAIVAVLNALFPGEFLPGDKSRE